MSDPWKRTRLLMGDQGVECLKNAVVLVAGCGGVGSFAIEALARSGVGHLILIDRDTVEETNINRQLCALHSTIGCGKTQVLKERIAQINPECQVDAWNVFYDSELDEALERAHPDYILDCIDSIGSKKDLIRFALSHSIPIIASMGMARKTDPQKVRLVELEKTAGDPIAKILRTWKRREKIRKKIMVVSSNEVPMKMVSGEPLPSAIFVPATAGLLMASQCVMDLQKQSACEGK